MSPVKSSTPTEAWLDDLERVVGLEVRGQVKAWVAGGLSEQRLKKAVRGAVDPRLVYERLIKANEEKGIYQQRVVIDEYTTVPGISKEQYKENSLPRQKTLANDFLSDQDKITFARTNKFGVNNEELDLPDYRATTFTKEAKLVKLEPGTILYRVTDTGGEVGPWWTTEPPNNLAEVIGGTAVMPEWNGFNKIFTAEIPDDGEPFYAWSGLAASQPVSLYKEKQGNGYSLLGGAKQIFLPNTVKNRESFKKSFKDCSKSLKKW